MENAELAPQFSLWFTREVDAAVPAGVSWLPSVRERRCHHRVTLRAARALHPPAQGPGTALLETTQYRCVTERALLMSSLAEEQTFPILLHPRKLLQGFELLPCRDFPISSQKLILDGNATLPRKRCSLACPTQFCQLQMLSDELYLM